MGYEQGYISSLEVGRKGPPNEEFISKQLTWKCKQLLSRDCGALLIVRPVDASRPEISLAKAIREILSGERCSLGLVEFLCYDELCHLVHVLDVYSQPEEGRTTQKMTNLGRLDVAQKLTPDAR